ncbi:hypothetical protein BJX99DRAFT_242939 [Aspergillus californicus]
MKPRRQHKSFTKPPSAKQQEVMSPAKDTSPICPEHPMTIELAVELVCYYSRQLYEPLQRLYIEVVHSIQNGTKIQDSMEDALKTVRWEELAETSSARQHKSVIFSLLEHIAVSTWLDQQISLAEQNFRTARNKPYTTRAATTKVLDSMFGKKDQTGQRDHLNTIRYRGNVLRDMLVSHLGLGILFSPVVWQLVKSTSEELDTEVPIIKNNHEQKTLLQLLGQQLKFMVETGYANADVFRNRLKETKLVLEPALESLFAKHQGILNVLCPTQSPTR